MVAGLSLAGLLLPEAVAYATIANLPPEAAVVALFAGLVCYGLIGTSRFAVVSATSSSAAVLAAATLGMAHGDATLRLALAAGLVLVTGALFIVASLASLGSLSDFIAKPVLRGFAFGLSIVIVLKQMPAIVGVSSAYPDVPRYAFDLVRQARAWNGVGLAVGAVALALLFLLGRFKRLPGALVVIAVGIGAARLLDLEAYGVALVGTIHVDLPTPGVPRLAAGDWLSLGELGAALVLVLYAESSSSIRSFALKHGDGVAPNRDLFALGVANLVGGLLHGMPVGAGYSATSANEAAGAQSRLAGLVSAAAVLVIVVTVLPLIALTPAPVLAAIVIHAVSHSINVAVFRPYLDWRRDRFIALAAVLSVLVLGVLNGLITAVAISMAMLLRGLSQAGVAELGRLGASHDFVDRRTHPQALPPPHVLVVRPGAPLFFVNAERILAQVRHRLDAHPGTTVLVLSLEETPDLDATTIEALATLARDVKLGGAVLLIARLKDEALEVLVRANLPDLPAALAGYFSCDDAVRAALQMEERNSAAALDAARD